MTFVPYIQIINNSDLKMEFAFEFGSENSWMLQNQNRSVIENDDIIRNQIDSSCN